MKERIIGAVVLVVFAVLVVPVFLDGPPEDDEIVSERVLLPGQDDQKTSTVVLDRDRTEPVPAATQPVPARQEPVATESAPAQAEPAEVEKKEPEVAAEEVPERLPEEPPEQTAPKPAVATSTASTTGMWAVQIGSYSKKDSAEKVAADLRKQGYAAFLSQVETEKGLLHRVRIGPQKDRASAEAMASRLAKVGHKGQVMPHP